MNKLIRKNNKVSVKPEMTIDFTDCKSFYDNIPYPDRRKIMLNIENKAKKKVKELQKEIKQYMELLKLDCDVEVVEDPEWGYFNVAF